MSNLLPQRAEALYRRLGLSRAEILARQGAYNVPGFALDHQRLLDRSRLPCQVRHLLQACLDAAQVLAHDRAALRVAQDVKLVGRALQLHEILGKQPVVLR